MFDTIRDIELTYNGDLTITNGDIGLVDGLDWFKREANKRLRSGPDWYHHPTLGADLGQFIGWNNTRVTAERIKQACRHSLTVGLPYDPTMLSVDVIPLSQEAVQLMIVVSGPDERTVIASEILRFDRGLVETFADPTTPLAPVSLYKKTTNTYLLRRR